MNPLLMFVIGLIIIIGIARFNESSKLFWTLLISFLSGIAVEGAYSILTTQKNNDNKVTLTKSTPTCKTSLSTYYFMKNEDDNTNELKAKLVGKVMLKSDYTYYRYCKDMEVPILTSIVPTIRGQCTKKLIYDTS